MRATVMEVSKKEFINNIKKIKDYVGSKEILPVIKANGYGTHINKELDILNHFNIVGVAIVDEGIDIRETGYKKDILILNQPDISEIDEIIENDLIIGISSFEFLNELIKWKDKVKVHLEIETGMNRTGIKLNELDDFVRIIKKHKNIIVEGIYTHLSSADYDEKYTKKQLDIFNKAVKKIIYEFSTIKYVHSQASNGLLKYNDDCTNLVRAGLIMYGFESFPGAKEIIDFKPICKLKTKITYLKEIDEGEAISYSQKFISNKKMKVATIPIGYADGLRRSLLNIGEVVIHNQKVKILGTICMDSCMIDVTDIKDVKVGDEVYIWDNENITLDDIAEKCNTINYEILSTISDRVPRIFK